MKDERVRIGRVNRSDVRLIIFDRAFVERCCLRVVGSMFVDQLLESVLAIRSRERLAVVKLHIVLQRERDS